MTRLFGLRNKAWRIHLKVQVIESTLQGSGKPPRAIGMGLCMGKREFKGIFEGEKQGPKVYRISTYWLNHEKKDMERDYLFNPCRSTAVTDLACLDGLVEEKGHKQPLSYSMFLRTEGAFRGKDLYFLLNHRS